MAALDVNTLFVAIAAGAGIAVLWGIHTEWRMNRLLRGRNGKSLEEVIVRNRADIEKFKEFRKELEAYLTSVEKRLDQSVRGVGTVRFNPFKGTGDGGNQSFATALLDSDENGVVISTLNTRERMSIFAKAINGGKAEQELTGEEKEAIRQAREKLHS